MSKILSSPWIKPLTLLIIGVLVVMYLTPGETRGIGTYTGRAAEVEALSPEVVIGICTQTGGEWGKLPIGCAPCRPGAPCQPCPSPEGCICPSGTSELWDKCWDETPFQECFRLDGHIFSADEENFLCGKDAVDLEVSGTLHAPKRAKCGDGFCEIWETRYTCVDDCSGKRSCNYDGVCDFWETPNINICPNDCPVNGSVEPKITPPSLTPNIISRIIEFIRGLFT